ncbi:MAG: TetR/AcrR family transcriptional regulator [Myxococcales bacterium]|nr:TetR/AcrR family transcriptional regulator [Myxococcales bacterium]
MARRRPDGKAEATRRRVLDTALALLRERGLEGTTMRAIAREAGLSLGAAYYHFPSKESIVLAWYEEQQAEHATRSRAAFAQGGDLRARLAAVYHGKLDLIAGERALLGALFHTVAAPDHPLSVFAATTLPVRSRAIAIFAEALDGEALPADLSTLLAPSLWLLLLGCLLYFLHDASPEQRRTRRLVDDTLDLVVPLIRLAALPGMGPVRGKLLLLLARADLIASPAI